MGRAMRPSLAPPFSDGRSAIFFDVDGVLIDSVEIKGEVFAEVFSDFPAESERILALHRAYGGVSRASKIKLMYRELTGNEIESHDYAQRLHLFSALIRDRVLRAPEISGARKTLEDLHEFFWMHAVSAMPIEELTQVLAKHQFYSFFRSVHGDPPQKSETVRELLDGHGYKTQDCFLVGDSRQDEQAALINRLTFIQVGKANNRKLGYASLKIESLQGLASFMIQQLAD